MGGGNIFLIVDVHNVDFRLKKKNSLAGFESKTGLFILAINGI